MKGKSARTASSRKQSSKKSSRRSARTKSRAAASRQDAKRILELSQEIETQRTRAYDRPRMAKAPRRVHVAAMGDSWFQYYPSWWDVLAQLRTHSWGNWVFDVQDTAKAGATLNEMVYGRTIVDTYQMLQQHPETDVFLFSGGGNDVTNDQMLDLLYNHKAVDNTLGTPEINKKVMQGLVGEVLHKTFVDLVELLRVKMADIGKPDMPIILHGYDYPFPDGRGWSLVGLHTWAGPWLDPPLAYKGYERTTDAAVRTKIIHALIDAFNDMVASVASSRPNTYYVNLRNILPKHAQWHNELHPREAGFKLVTDEIVSKIKTVL